MAGNADAAQQFQIHAVELRREELAQARVVDAGLNQFEQEPFVLLLSDCQTAVAEQIADEQDGLLIPWLGTKTGGPHRQRAAGFVHAVVHPFAIGGDVAKGAIVEAADFIVQQKVQTDAAKEAVGFDKLGLVGNQLGRAAAGQGARKEHLRRPIESVQISQPVERRAPGAGGNVRHAIFIAKRLQAAAGMFEVQRLHANGGN